jgi:hypothetical protein
MEFGMLERPLHLKYSSLLRLTPSLCACNFAALSILAAFSMAALLSVSVAVGLADSTVVAAAAFSILAAAAFASSL